MISTFKISKICTNRLHLKNIQFQGCLSKVTWRDGKGASCFWHWPLLDLGMWLFTANFSSFVWLISQNPQRWATSVLLEGVATKLLRHYCTNVSKKPHFDGEVRGPEHPRVTAMEPLEAALQTCVSSRFWLVLFKIQHYMGTLFVRLWKYGYDINWFMHHSPNNTNLVRFFKPRLPIFLPKFTYYRPLEALLRRSFLCIFSPITACNQFFLTKYTYFFTTVCISCT